MASTVTGLDHSDHERRRVLGRVGKPLQPQPDSRERDHGQVVRGALLVAGRNATELLQPVDQALDDVARPVEDPVKQRGARLVASRCDDRADPVEPQVGSYCPGAVAFVAYQGARTAARSSTTSAGHGPLIHQLVEDDRLVPLPGRQHEDQGLASTLGAKVQLAGEATLATAQSLRFRGPPFAPAACWWARMTVPST